jgi:hypothetical protein
VNVFALARRLRRGAGQRLLPDTFVESLSPRGSWGLRDCSGI